MAEFMVYILPLLLGRTFDMRKYTVGVDIFPAETVNNATVINKPFCETRYKFVESTREARDLLDVGASASLKIKSGIHAGASGSYLDDTGSRENGIEMLIRTQFETVTETLPSSAVPKVGWRKENPGSLGTHYVRSVTYGGELITSVMLKSNTTRQKMHIKGAVEAGGKASGFLDVGGKVEGEYMKQLSKDVDSMEIKYYSSVPISFVPSSMDQLHELLDSFYDELQNYNEGKGVPIKVELWPLTSLEPGMERFTKNGILEGRLDEIEDRMDDLLKTRTALRNWLTSIDKELTDKQEKELGQFNDQLETVLQEFYKMIGNLDISGDEKQLSPAIHAYDKNVDVPIHNPYYRLFLKLREEVVKDIPTDTWKPVPGNGAIYTRWGSNNCSGVWPETIAVGYVASSDSTVVGGVSNYLCLPENLELGIEGADLHTPRLVRTSFEFLSLQENGKMVNRTGLASCAMCRLPTAGSVRTFPGIRHCPIHWIALYDGHLLGDSKNGNLVCLDRNAEISDAEYPNQVTLLKNAVVNESKIVPCVVCTN